MTPGIEQWFSSQLHRIEAELQQFGREAQTTDGARIPPTGRRVPPKPHQP